MPFGGGQTERQVQLIHDFRPEIIMVTPSYMLAIADEFERLVVQVARLLLLARAHVLVRPRAVRDGAFQQRAVLEGVVERPFERREVLFGRRVFVHVGPRL